MSIQTMPCASRRSRTGFARTSSECRSASRIAKKSLYRSSTVAAGVTISRPARRDASSYTVFRKNGRSKTSTPMRRNDAIDVRAARPRSTVVGISNMAPRSTPAVSSPHRSRRNCRATSWFSAAQRKNGPCSKWFERLLLPPNAAFNRSSHSGESTASRAAWRRAPISTL